MTAIPLLHATCILVSVDRPSRNTSNLFDNAVRDLFFSPEGIAPVLQVIV